MLGLVPVLAGGAFIEWAIVSHFRESPPDAPLTAKPDYLAQDGAYARSRNPLYTGGLTMWLGWSWFFGSRRVAAGLLVMAAFFRVIGVPYEERLLTAKFGDTYRDYSSRVPRWI